MGVRVARMQHCSTKAPEYSTFRYHLADACVLVHANSPPKGGSVSDIFGAFTSSDLEGGSMQINSENRAVTWTRGLVTGLSAVAMAAAISVASPRDAQAANCGAGNIIIGPNGLADGSSFLLCAGNLYAGALNGSGNGNSFGFGASVQLFNAAIGFGNQMPTATAGCSASTSNLATSRSGRSTKAPTATAFSLVLMSRSATSRSEL